MHLRIALVALGVLFACSASSSSVDDSRGACPLLASRCHASKSALGKECHELGHGGDGAKCGPRKDECLAECPETVREDASVLDGGNTPTDGGAEADAAPTPCQVYCTCMTATCAGQSGYPFADEPACLAACAGFVATDVACYADHCEDAKVAADKAHDCEHASGTVACH